MTYLRFHRRAFVGVQYALFAAACLSFTTAPRAGEASTRIPGSAQQIYADPVPDWIFAVPTELDVCTKSHVSASVRGYWFRLVDLDTGPVPNYLPPPRGSR